MGAQLPGGREHRPWLLGGSCRAFPTGVREGGNPSSVPSPCSSQRGCNPSDYRAIISLGLWDRNPAAIATSRQVEAKPERVRAGCCGGMGRGSVGPR